MAGANPTRSEGGRRQSSRVPGARCVLATRAGWHPPSRHSSTGPGRPGHVAVSPRRSGAIHRVRGGRSRVKSALSGAGGMSPGPSESKAAPTSRANRPAGSSTGWEKVVARVVFEPHFLERIRLAPAVAYLDVFLCGLRPDRIDQQLGDHEGRRSRRDRERQRLRRLRAVSLGVLCHQRDGGRFTRLEAVEPHGQVEQGRARSEHTLFGRRLAARKVAMTVAGSSLLTRSRTQSAAMERATSPRTGASVSGPGGTVDTAASFRRSSESRVSMEQPGRPTGPARTRTRT